MNGKSATNLWERFITTNLWERFIIWLSKQTAKINSFLMKNAR